MSTITPESSSGTSRRLSRLAVASLLCGLAAPVIGFLTLGDVGSDFSDLLTLIFVPLMVAVVVLCILAHRAIGKAPERLTGTGHAKAGAILAGLTVLGLILLVPAT